jgi:protein-disulfide isomerase
MRRAVFSLLAALTAASGCRGAREEHAAAPDAGLAQAAPSAAEDAFWAHTKPVFAVPVGRSPARGPAGALVTIVEFSEFQCRPCASVDATLEQLREKYGEAVRVVWKNKPLSLQPAAEPAAEAALEVRAEKGDAAFWQVHDRFVERRDELVKADGPDVDAIVKIATDAGASPESVRRAVALRTHREEIEADVDLAEDLEVEGAPAVFVNGRRLEGVQPRPRLERMIDEELRRAQERIATGTPPDGVYAALVGSGRGPWVPSVKPLPRLPANDPALGGARARVAIHVWSDYQCARCAAVERAMSDLRRQHGDRIRFVWHDLPLPRHRDARIVAEAGREAYRQLGTPGFWAMHDRIAYAVQAPTRADLDGFAKDARLDMSTWKTALDGAVHAGDIDADEAAARDVGITETPAFLVVSGGAAQGTFVGNLEYASKLRRVVERALDDE